MKILLLDIETTPNKGWFWEIFKQNLGIHNIDEPGYTLCWAAKWYDGGAASWRDREPVIYDGLNQSSMERMIAEIWSLLDQADAVVHYNGNKFDIPTLNKEFLLQGMGPPSPYANIDLYRIIRSTFKFTSNKLDYICQQLGIGAKINHKGHELWKGCMQNREDDWKVMTEYNIEDVLLTERLYERVKPWIRTHPNHGLFVDEDARVCPNCGSTNVQRRGSAYTRVTEYARYYCNDCKTWPRGKEKIRGVDLR